MMLVLLCQAVGSRHPAMIEVVLSVALVITGGGDAG
jgi:hypothetical protein